MSRALEQEKHFAAVRFNVSCCESVLAHSQAWLLAGSIGHGTILIAAVQLGMAWKM